MDNILIRQLKQEEFPEALALAWEVFKEFEAPDYSEEGTLEFYKSIHDPDYLNQLAIIGAFSDNLLVGIMATRSVETHVALFFVQGKYHRQGIGKQLFQAVLEKCPSDRMTVNSSPYAVPVYHRLGFADTDKEQVMNGIRFTPMKYDRNIV